MSLNPAHNDLLVEPLERLLGSHGFFAASNAELLGALEYCSESDIELLSYAWCELVRRNKAGKVLAAEKICEERGLKPIPWISAARQSLACLVPPVRRNYTQHVYVILRDGYMSNNGYGLYVGVTSKSPEERFDEHITPDHQRAARGLPEHGICLLRSLMHPYVKVPGADRLKYETSTHLALSLSGARVTGDIQDDYLNWLPEFQPKLMQMLDAHDKY